MNKLFQLFTNKQLISQEWDPNQAWFKKLNQLAVENYAGENTAFAGELFNFRKELNISENLVAVGMGDGLTGAEIHQQLRDIYDNYVADGAPNQININSEMRNQIKNLMVNLNDASGQDKQLVGQIVSALQVAEQEVKKLLVVDVLPRAFAKELEADSKLNSMKAMIEKNAKESNYKFDSFFGGTKITLEDGTKVKVPGTIAKIYNEITKNGQQDPVKTLSSVHDHLAGKSLDTIKGADKDATHKTYAALREKFADLKADQPKQDDDPSQGVTRSRR